MELKRVRAAFVADLSINMDDIEVLEYLSRPGYPVARWICETYHIHGDVNQKKIENTLRKINLALSGILEKKKEVMSMKVIVE